MVGTGAVGVAGSARDPTRAVMAGNIVAAVPAPHLCARRRDVRSGIAREQVTRIHDHSG